MKHYMNKSVCVGEKVGKMVLVFGIGIKKQIKLDIFDSQYCNMKTVNLKKSLQWLYLRYVDIFTHKSITTGRNTK